MTIAAMVETNERQTWQVNKDNLDNIWSEDELKNVLESGLNTPEYLDVLIGFLQADFKAMLDYYKNPSENSKSKSVFFKDFQFSDYWSHGTADLFCVGGKLVQVCFAKATDREGYYQPNWGTIEVIGPRTVIEYFKDILTLAK